jgi:hypothetical protein
MEDASSDKVVTAAVVKNQAAAGLDAYALLFRMVPAARCRLSAALLFPMLHQARKGRRPSSKSQIRRRICTGPFSQMLFPALKGFAYRGAEFAWHATSPFQDPAPRSQGSSSLFAGSGAELVPCDARSGSRGGGNASLPSIGRRQGANPDAVRKRGVSWSWAFFLLLLVTGCPPVHRTRPPRLRRRDVATRNRGRSGWIGGRGEPRRTRDSGDTR